MTEPLNAAAIVDVLNRHGVRYVVIGAFAAIAQRAPIPVTRDIDLTSRRRGESDPTLEGLGRARSDPIDTVGGGLPFDHDGRSLAASSVWNLICPYGEFDISFVPSGIAGGYEELALKALRMRVDTVDVLVADLSDVIRSKEAAGRPKDLQILPILYRFDRERRNN